MGFWFAVTLALLGWIMLPFSYNSPNGILGFRLKVAYTNQKIWNYSQVLFAIWLFVVFGLLSIIYWLLDSIGYRGASVTMLEILVAALLLIILFLFANSYLKERFSAEISSENQEKSVKKLK